MRLDAGYPVETLIGSGKLELRQLMSDHFCRNLAFTKFLSRNGFFRSDLCYMSNYDASGALSTNARNDLFASICAQVSCVIDSIAAIAQVVNHFVVKDLEDALGIILTGCITIYPCTNFIRGKPNGIVIIAYKSLGGRTFTTFWLRKSN